jgi:probable rRNA maturation factor
MRRAGPPERALSIEVLCTVAGAPPVPRVRDWTRNLLSKAGAKRRLSLSILFCGDARMRGLNREWLGMDLPTDVLSFPSGEKDFLGDIVIDVPYAARQARARGHSPARELRILLAHGLLHLLGYDHETDDGTMFRLQRRLILATFRRGPDGVP